ncbi:MAG: methyltransferase type 11 [Clostridiaceae bacterium]|nr:methyltransferase type 11 [Clostridiaceae bacterium]
MTNPWEEIRLTDYERHMSRKNVFQLQAINRITAEQLFDFNIRSVMIMGITGGNGLEHIHPSNFDRVYGVDINRNYLVACVLRFPSLVDIFEPICADLREERIRLPHADLVIANLLIEYIGYDSFIDSVKQVAPRFVSCGIIDDANLDPVSDSSYSDAFDRLDEVYRQTDEFTLTMAMREIGYSQIQRKEIDLPNRKSIVRLDYVAKDHAVSDDMKGS